MTFVVGITGGIGSGKSAVTSLLERQGITIVDADLASRVIVEPGRPALDAISEHFQGKTNEDIILPNGTLNRAALRTIVFSNDEDRLWLEQLTHPLIGEEIQRQLLRSTSAYTVLSSPLLLEMTQKNLTQCVVVIDISEDLQIQRAAQRDDNDEDQIKKIMAAQMNREERLAQADIVIDNSKSLSDLKQLVGQLHSQLLIKAAKSAGT